MQVRRDPNRVSALDVSQLRGQARGPKIGTDSSPWDDAALLNETRVSVGGRVTLAALLLLGALPAI